MNFTAYDIVLLTALGQLVATAIVVVAWTIVQTWRFISTFYRAARDVQIEVTAKKR